MLYQGLENVPLFVLPTSRPGDYYLIYPMNHYVIISKKVEDENNEFGEISDQSMLVFTTPQDKEVARSLPNGYLVLSQYGNPRLQRLL